MSKYRKEEFSKSLFSRGQQCHKSLYLHKNHPELRNQPLGSQGQLESGAEVGELARGLFPGGVLVPYDGLSAACQLELTSSLVGNGVKTIYEASFDYDGIFIKVDILRKGRGGWEVYEVKSSCDVKQEHIQDVALQYFVLNGLGIKISKVFVVHINREYVRHSDIDVRSLFKIVNVKSETLDLQKNIKRQISSLRKMLAGDEPDIDIGPHCDDPHECDFSEHCWQHIPEQSVFSLAGRGIDKFDYYRRGMIGFSDLPLGELNDKQRQQVKATLKKKKYFDKPAVRDFLNTLWYPLCHLDFETINTPIPLFDDTKPYQQIPFQYSLHIQHEEGGVPVHYEFLAESGEDPRKKLLNKLLKEIPTGACVLSYNMSFEKHVLRDLAELFPRRVKRINQIIEDLRDLMLPFRSRAVYHWKMQGSYSIKKVLPALVPKLTYKGMEISDGGMAMDAYRQMCVMTDQEEIGRTRKALLAYCELDTFAMVKILNRISSVPTFS